MGRRRTLPRREAHRGDSQPALHRARSLLWQRWPEHVLSQRQAKLQSGLTGNRFGQIDAKVHVLAIAAIVETLHDGALAVNRPGAPLDAVVSGVGPFGARRNFAVNGWLNQTLRLLVQ